MKSPLRLAAKAGFLLGVLILLAVGGGLAALNSWRADRIAELTAAGELAQTAAGPVEFLVQGDGPPLLVFHGEAGGFDQAMLLGSEWSTDDFQVIAWSRPGYLRTPLVAGAEFEQQADTAAALLDTLGLESVAVAGISAGAPAAIQFALRHPQRARALVLLSAVTGPLSLEPKSGMAAQFLRNGETADLGTWILQETAAADFPRAVAGALEFESTLDPESRRKLADDVLAHPGQSRFVRELFATITPLSARLPGLSNDAERIRSLPELPLEKLALPVLVAHGAADRQAPLADARRAADRIPGAIFLPVEGAGHFLAIGPRADETKAAVGNFLLRHSGGPSQP